MVLLSHVIADLPTNMYYDRVETWYGVLKNNLAQYGCTVGEMPEIHSHSGRGFIEFTGRESGQIFFTWYKMPSGRYEIVCYRC